MDCFIREVLDKKSQIIKVIALYKSYLCIILRKFRLTISNGFIMHESKNQKNSFSSNPALYIGIGNEEMRIKCRVKKK